MLRVILFLLGILSALYGFVVMASSKSAIHEIEAGVAFLSFAVFFAGAAVCDAINTLRTELLAEMRKPPAANS